MPGNLTLPRVSIFSSRSNRLARMAIGGTIRTDWTGVRTGELDALELGSDRLDLGKGNGRVNLQIERLDWGIDRLALGKDGFGLETSTLVLGNNRIGFEIYRLDLSGDILKLGSDRLGLRSQRLDLIRDRLDLRSGRLDLLDLGSDRRDFGSNSGSRCCGYSTGCLKDGE